jgi:DNA-binding transcriptional regulator PaaX
MKKPITEKLLYIIATVADYNHRCFSWQLALSMSGDPRRYKYRRWLEKMLRNKKDRHKLQQTLYRLKKAKLLEEKIFNNTKGYILSPRGFMKLYRIQLEHKKKEKYPQGHYLMVFFDIPEKQRQLRNCFRSLLRELGFQKIQQSVWATQYQVANELQQIIKDYGLDKYVKPLVVKELPK